MVREHDEQEAQEGMAKASKDMAEHSNTLNDIEKENAKEKGREADK